MLKKNHFVSYKVILCLDIVYFLELVMRKILQIHNVTIQNSNDHLNIFFFTTYLMRHMIYLNNLSSHVIFIQMNDFMNIIQ